MDDEENRDKQTRLYEQAQVHISNCRPSLRHINANQHLSTGLSQRSQLVEFTEIIEYDVTLGQTKLIASFPVSAHMP